MVANKRARGCGSWGLEEDVGEDAGGVTTSETRRRRRRAEPEDAAEAVFDDGPPGVAPGPPEISKTLDRSRRRRRAQGGREHRRQAEQEDVFDDGPPGAAPGPPAVPSSARRGPRPSRGGLSTQGPAELLQYYGLDDDEHDFVSQRGLTGSFGGRNEERGGAGKGGRQNNSNEAEDFPKDADDSDDDIPGLEEAKGLWGNRRRRRRGGGSDDAACDDADAAPDDAESDQPDNQAPDDYYALGKKKSRRAKKARAERDGTGAVSWKVPMGDDELSDFVYSVRLEMVPTEYSHATLVELHDTLGLRNFQTSVVIDNPEDAPGTHTMMLRYGNQASAEAACVQLSSQGVASGTGEVWELVAKVTKKEVANPFCSVYISDLPTDFTDSMLAEMHKDCGLGPDAAPVSLKRLPTQDPMDEASCCIARYKTSAAADSAIQAMHGLPVTTVSGHHKTLGARRAKPAKWMDGYGGAGAYTSGAYTADAGKGAYGGGVYGGGVVYGGVPPPPPSWGGKGHKGKGNDAKSREWMEKEAERNSQPVQCGVSLFGKVKSWNEERGFGLLQAENGGQDIFVHRSALRDGRFLEPNTDVTFEVGFDVSRGKYRATMCHGAMGEDPRQAAVTAARGPPDHVPLPPNTPPPVNLFGAQARQTIMSAELKGFCNYWGLDHSCATHLASFDAEMQTRILSEFNPSFGNWDSDGRMPISSKVRFFVKCLQQRIDSAVPEGIPITGIVKEWNEEAQFGFVAHEEAKPDTPHILVHKNALTDGSRLSIDAEVVLQVDWDAQRGMHTASTCSGADGDAPEPLVLSDELVAFSSQFDFNRPTLMYLLELPSDVLARVIAEFPATVATVDEANTNYNIVVRSFTVSMRAKAQVQIPVGVMLNGKCQQWLEGKGYGFVVADSGGGKIFVHCSHIVDGDALEQGASVKFEVQWEEDRRRYTVTKCEGGVSKPVIQMEVSSELEAFGQVWDCDRDTLSWLATFPEDVLSVIIKKFNPYPEGVESAGPEPRSTYRRLKAFARSLKDGGTGWDDALAPVSNAPAEVSQQLSYFGQLWELDQETVEWIARLPNDVQTAVTEEFMGTHSDETLDVRDVDAEEKQPPREELFISGLPHTLHGSNLPAPMQKGLLTQLFSQFGQVLHCKVITKKDKPDRNAIIQLENAKQGKMAVEDLHRKIPNGFPSPILVRFFVDRSPKAATNMDELKCNEWLTGKISAFYADRGFGFIQPDGGGPDVFCYGSAKGAHSPPLEKGCAVGFEADWNEERKQYFTTKVAVTSEGGPPSQNAVLGEDGAIGSSRTVRAFARHIHARVKPSTVGVLGPLKIPTAAQQQQLQQQRQQQQRPQFTAERPNLYPPAERNPALPAPGGGLSLWQTPAAKEVGSAAAPPKLFSQQGGNNGGNNLPGSGVTPSGLSFSLPSAAVVLKEPGVKEELSSAAPADAEPLDRVSADGFT